MEDQDLGLGRCARPQCPRFAAVGLNGMSICLQHFEAELRMIRGHVEKVIRAAREDRRVTKPAGGP